jgi:hypothetical protein
MLRPRWPVRNLILSVSGALVLRRRPVVPWEGTQPAIRGVQIPLVETYEAGISWGIDLFSFEEVCI